MLELIGRPLSPIRLVQLSIGLVAVNTLYCLAYTALAGHGESLGQAVGWSIANLLPWLWAFEAGKRWRAPLPAVIGGAAVSLALGVLLLSSELSWFEAARRFPAAAAVLALLLAVTSLGRGAARGEVALPVPPDRIAWVAAAGNYVELHGGERPLLVRAPLAAVAAALAPHGFVRIHRSTLVNRKRVARVRSVDLILDDGRSLKLGSRFKAQLLA
jgi:hypothetical protein